LRSRRMRALVLGSSLCLPAVLVRGDEPQRQPFHADPAVLERTLADTILALSRGDAPAMRSGLDGIEKACRRTRDDEPYPKELLTFDNAFHLTVDRARELAGAGDIEHSAQQFCWIQGACRKCHDEARKSGVLPPKPRKP